jgi:electron transfer flavoprotein beta subunit
MNIVVAMKQIPDLQQIRISNRRPVLEDVPLTFGSIDKSALEAAVVIRESSGEEKVLVLSAGTEELEDTIKEALAAGGDEACLIIDESLAEADSSMIAQVLAAGIKQLDNVDLILFGEGSGDNYSGQVGSRVARLLGLPQVG